MQAREKRWDRGCKFPQSTACDEHLLNGSKGYLTQSERKNNRNTEHLSCIIEHVENACRRSARMRFHRTHDRVGIGRHEKAGTTSH